MDENQVKILAALLELSKQVISGNPDSSVIQSNIEIINGISEDYFGMIEEKIHSLIDSYSITAADTLTTIISSLTSLSTSKDALLGLIKIRNLKEGTDIAAYIDAAVTGSINDFSYYSALCNLAISLGDTARIEKVITKLQSIGSTSGSTTSAAGN